MIKCIVATFTYSAVIILNFYGVALALVLVTHTEGGQKKGILKRGTEGGK